ncbi:PH domain-like protein [Armillaria solidipes]|uniref:PH domain-like protein n=1 Tax=Armillaria solidipes TaxID=1076256 RepID=A0A2H3BKT4_9AGAR|nr:PH domain-like protein [Armillaria solidipes]
MPSQSTLSKEEKDKVKSAIPSPSNKIFYATLARVYYAYPQPNEWAYTGLQGALALVKNNSTGALSFRLVDMSSTRGVIWEHEFYDGLDYFADRAFFHSFPGDDSMIGFVFSNESEAKDFWKKVLRKKDEKRTPNPETEKKKKANKGGKIDKCMISGPTSGSFVHVAHMGYDSESGFTSKGVDPSWTAFLGQLENSGIDKEAIAREMEFIKDFVRSHPQQQPAAAKEPRKPKPPPPTSRRAHGQNDSISAPPPPLRRPQPPPATAPSHTLQPPPRTPQPPARPPPAAASAPPPPPVRPPVRATPGPPLPPTRPTSSAPTAPPSEENGRQKNQDIKNKLELLLSPEELRKRQALKLNK